MNEPLIFDAVSGGKQPSSQFRPDPAWDLRRSPTSAGGLTSVRSPPTFQSRCARRSCGCTAPGGRRRLFRPCSPKINAAISTRLQPSLHGGQRTRGCHCPLAGRGGTKDLSSSREAEVQAVWATELDRSTGPTVVRAARIPNAVSDSTVRNYRRRSRTSVQSPPPESRFT